MTQISTKLAQLGIHTICDFRHDDERSREPSRWPSAPKPTLVHLPLEEGDHAITLKRLLSDSSSIGAEQIIELMAAINRDFVIRHSDVYSQLLRHLLETSDPMLIHCTRRQGSNRLWRCSHFIRPRRRSGLDHVRLPAHRQVSGY
jgi:protein tyrosine/serine phosphatase